MLLDPSRAYASLGRELKKNLFFVPATLTQIVGPNNYFYDLQISTIQLEISPNRLNCRYLQLNWRYLQINWRYLQNNWRYLQILISPIEL